jgi:hypothetical protein
MMPSHDIAKEIPVLRVPSYNNALDCVDTSRRHHVQSHAGQDGIYSAFVAVRNVTSVNHAADMVAITPQKLADLIACHLTPPKQLKTTTSVNSLNAVLFVSQVLRTMPAQQRPAHVGVNSCFTIQTEGANHTCMKAINRFTRGFNGPGTKAIDIPHVVTAIARVTFNRETTILLNIFPSHLTPPARYAGHGFG